MLGGPIAKFIIEKHQLKQTVYSAQPLQIGVSHENAKFASVNIDQFLISVLLIYYHYQYIAQTIRFKDVAN